MKVGQRRIGSLEIGRGVAASLVVLHHAGNAVEQSFSATTFPFGGHLHYFYVGVDFFFVLSGFIIAWVHWDDIGKPSALKGYALKRFLRIYPPYWGVLIPLAIFYATVSDGGYPARTDPINVVMSFFLLPYPPYPVLGVGWTLVHEVLFYAVFAAVISIGRKAFWLLPAWAVLILVASAGDPLPFLPGFLLSPFNLEFLFGVAAAAILRRWTIPYPAVFAALGAFLFFLFMLVPSLVPQDPIVLRFAFGLPAAMFVLGMVEIEWTRPIRLPPLLVFFGASSFAVYLVHPMAMSLAARLVRRVIGDGLGLEGTVLLLAAVGLAAGMLYHYLLEKRLVSLARRVLDRWTIARPSEGIIR